MNMQSRPSKVSISTIMLVWQFHGSYSFTYTRIAAAKQKRHPMNWVATEEMEILIKSIASGIWKKVWREERLAAELVMSVRQAFKSIEYDYVIHNRHTRTSKDRQKIDASPDQHCNSVAEADFTLGKRRRLPRALAKSAYHRGPQLSHQ